VIELYAITDHPGPPLPDVAPLNAVATEHLAAVCAPASDGEVSPDALWRHEDVVEALMEDRDLLPVRFGTCLEDESAAVLAVAERYDELAVALDRVRGAVELSLRVVVADEPTQAAHEEPGSGADYLRAKTRCGVERETAVRVLHEPLSILARASLQVSPRSPSELLRAAYLVDRPAVEGFVGLVARLQSVHPGLRLLCTGPWPPYSFAER
jgi:hypothetical protein